MAEGRQVLSVSLSACCVSCLDMLLIVCVYGLCVILDYEGMKRVGFNVLSHNAADDGVCVSCLYMFRKIHVYTCCCFLMKGMRRDVEASIPEPRCG